MSEIDAVKRALERERAARAKAERLLEDKTRELYLSNTALQEQNSLLNTKNSELVLLSNVTKLAEQNSTKNEQLQQFITNICELCGWPLGHFFFVKKRSETEIQLTPSNQWFCKKQEKYQQFIDSTANCVFAANQGLPGIIYQKNKPVWFEDIFTEHQFQRSTDGKAVGIHGAFGTPIYRYNEIIAVVEFFSENTEAKNKDLLMLIETAAIQLSTMMERQFSEKQLTENYKQLQQTHEELKNTQAQLLQNSKLASIGQLAAGVAHEINNPIAFVANNISILKKYMKNIKSILEGVKQQFTSDAELDSIKSEITQLLKKNNTEFILEDIDELITDSTEGMERVTTIVADLKSFSRVDEAEVSAIDINETIEATLKIVWNELKYKCELEKNFSSLPLLECYPSQINQVIMNLLVNAGQAIEEKGTIAIDTRQQNEKIQIQISDTGSGIKPENIEKLFDPFFTTKPVGTGTGLGLSISYGIIKKHGGDIRVESTLNVGTSFTIDLPLKQTTQPAPPAAQ